MKLFLKTGYDTSELITKNYSTSFAKAVGMLAPQIRNAVYAVYGFVRLADEIVDTLHNFDKELLLNKFEEDLWYAIENRISTNPVLNAFQDTVHKFGIKKHLIEAFLKSMRADLKKINYTTELEIKEYIFGSADVVGLMCLQIFCAEKPELYNKLEGSAMKLGSAFQKVNFLRDLKNDTQDLGRFYFPEMTQTTFTNEIKSQLVKLVSMEFEEAYQGIKQLPDNSKLAVLIAYDYYLQLLKAIDKCPADKILSQRIRVADSVKSALFLKNWVRYKLNFI